MRDTFTLPVWISWTIVINMGARQVGLEPNLS